MKIDLGKNIFEWGPNHIRVFYCSDWIEAVFGKNYYKKIHPDKRGYWPTLLLLSKKELLSFVGNDDTLKKVGGWVFENYILNTKAKKKVEIGWKQDLKKLQSIESKIAKVNLSGLSDRDFIALWDTFHGCTASFWQNVIIPELANYGSIPLLEKNLKKEISKDADMSHILEVLTAPSKSSFYEKEEIDLYNSKNLLLHTRKYFWLKNNYGHVEILNQKYFADRKRKLSKHLPLEIKERKVGVTKRKKDVIKRFKLSNMTKQIAESIVECIEWQDERKKHIWMYLHYKDLLIEEMAKRVGVDKDILLDYREVELSQMFKDKGFQNLGRSNFRGYLLGNHGVRKIDSNLAQSLWGKYLDKSTNAHVDQISGIIASKRERSLVVGRAKVVMNPALSQGFELGDVLVTTMTTPEFVFLMKDASAIVTDTGGLTSHAAIVARELKKPCIIGTKIATKVLKDGDVVEVDAELGTVKIIKRAD